MNEVNTDISRLEKSTFSPYFFFLPHRRGAEGAGMVRYLRYESARSLPTNRNPISITSFTNSYLEKKASATRISVKESNSAAFDLTREIYQSSIDMCLSDSRVLKFGDWTAPSITHVCLLRLIARLPLSPACVSHVGPLLTRNGLFRTSAFRLLK